ncbi:unnamed protein product [Brugia pahangi]|uniref:CBS domain-containing protein n=1 Tax=Brugia pahangi TaxID=6280 RepID=A0A0N4TPE2_BRUPA|nr:unnamed protein product [Brugia pahangi]
MLVAVKYANYKVVLWMDDGSVVGVAASINLIQSKDLIEFDRFSGYQQELMPPVNATDKGLPGKTTSSSLEAIRSKSFLAGHT